MGENSYEHQQQPTVFFLLSKPDLDAAALERVYVFPSDKDWNDFGYRINYNYIYLSQGVQLCEGDILLGLLDSQTGIGRVIEEKLDMSGRHFLTKEDVPTFFSMHSSMQAYRHLISTLDLSRTRLLLSTINDLVALRHYPNTPDWLDTALETEVFTLAFMRNSEPFYAFHNAGEILGGLGEEKLDSISNDLDLTFKLDGFENSHSIRFRFDQRSILPKRIAVLIGKNGLGKSQTLNQLIRAALQYSGTKANLSDPSRGRPHISRILAIGTPGETTNTFPAERVTTQKIFYRRLLMTRGSRSKSSRGVGELLVQLARLDESIRTKTRWQLFIDALRTVMPVEEISIPLIKAPIINSKTYSIGENYFVRLSDFQLNSGEQARLGVWGAIHPSAEPMRYISEIPNHYPLSSGQLAFFRFALQACLYVENGSLILMDEPETHLHPNLISDFIDLLDILLETTGSLAIIATHSAYFVREVPRDQVQVFKTGNNREIYIGNPRLKTFGADVGAISYFVFEEETTNRLVDKLSNQISRQNIDETLESLKSELSSEAVMALKHKLAGGSN